MKPMRKSEQLDQELALIHLSAERREQIKKRLREGADMDGRQWTIRTSLIAAALCALLAVSALAASPTLRDAVQGLLGGFAPYAQTVEGAAATDQGIQVSVVRAVADATDGWYYLEVKDLTGDRLTEDTYLDGAAQSKAYDPESRTVLAQGAARARSRNEDGTMTIALQEIWGGERFEGVVLPRELLEPDNVLESMQLSDEHSHGTGDDRVVLVPGQTPMDLAGAPGFALSSMGFDEKGRLHVQIRVEDGYEVPEWEFYLGREIWQVGDAKLRSGGGYSFEQEGMRFVDFRTNFFEDFREETYVPKEAYQGLELTLEGWIATRERIRGNWEVTFPLELLPDRPVRVNQAVNGKIVESLTLSAMNAALKLRETEEQGSLWNLPMTVYLADGSAFTVERGLGAASGQAGFYRNYWKFPEPVEPDQVTAIALGYWYIPLDGAAAQPGHWLAELPQ